MKDYFNISLDGSQLQSISSIGLAHLGDAVYELLVRSWLCAHGRATGKGLHRAAQFESLTYPGIIMTSLLFAFSGVFLILWLTGHTLNVMSLIGAIMLIGIVVKNGIVLIDYITLNRERGMGIRTAVILGGKSRLRPVVMTTLTTILGMVPMAVGSGQGSEMWRPMGTAVIGGLTFSTILTLLFVPVLYCVFAGRGVKRNRKIWRKQYLKLNKK